MTRSYPYKKNTVEDCISLSVIEMRRRGHFRDLSPGSIDWKYEFRTKTLHCTLVFQNAEPTTYLSYSVRSKPYGECNANGLVKVESTRCYFGGKRYWFCCPAWNKHGYCGKRVAKLYLSPDADYLGCRDCHQLTYRARQEHRCRFEHLSIAYRYQQKQEDLEEDVKREFYAGKPTRIYQRHCRYKAKTSRESTLANLKFERLTVN